MRIVYEKPKNIFVNEEIIKKYKLKNDYCHVQIYDENDNLIFWCDSEGIIENNIKKYNKQIKTKKTWKSKEHYTKKKILLLYQKSLKNVNLLLKRIASILNT